MESNIKLNFVEWVLIICAGSTRLGGLSGNPSLSSGIKRATRVLSADAISDFPSRRLVAERSGSGGRANRFRAGEVQRLFTAHYYAT
jgi:hypothetical protein